jgi:hypothetical protein
MRRIELANRNSLKVISDFKGLLTLGSPPPVPAGSGHSFGLSELLVSVLEYCLAVSSQTSAEPEGHSIRTLLQCVIQTQYQQMSHAVRYIIFCKRRNCRLLALSVDNAL